MFQTIYSSTSRVEKKNQWKPSTTNLVIVYILCNNFPFKIELLVVIYKLTLF